MNNATKNTLKWVKSLYLTKYRNTYKCFIVEGDKMVQDALKHHPNQLKCIFHVSPEIIPYSIPDSCEVFQIKSEDLRRISKMKTPHNSLAVINYLNFSEESSNLVLACDSIQDPGNFGTIIRTADWFGVKTIWASKNTVDKYNSKVIQASMGSIFRVNVKYLDLKEVLSETKKRVYGTTLNGKVIQDSILQMDSVIVMGNEGGGISEEVLKCLDEELLIPGKGFAESLNVGVATGILLSFFTSLE